MDNAKAAEQRAQKVVRVRKALEMRTRGATDDQIAEALGVHRRTARGYVDAALDELRRETKEDTRRYVALELSINDHLRREAEVIAATAPDGTTKLSAMRLLKDLSESRRKLLGLDAPTKVEHSGEVDTFVQVIRLPEGVPEP